MGDDSVNVNGSVCLDGAKRVTREGSVNAETGAEAYEHHGYSPFSVMKSYLDCIAAITNPIQFQPAGSQLTYPIKCA